MIPLDDALAALDHATAIAAVRTALRDGLDPETQTPRSVDELAYGQMLLMPAELGGFVGVKLATVAPGNPARSLPRIQGTYVLLDRKSVV